MPVAEGVGIADVSVFVVMLFIVGALWILVHMRGPVASLPIVGGTGVNLIDGMRQTLTAWATNVESFLTWQQSQASQLWAAFVTNIMTPALNAVDTALTAQIHVVQNVATAQLRAQQQQLQAEIDAVNRQLVPAIHALESQLGAAEKFVQSVVVVQLDQVVADVRAAERVLQTTRGELDQARQQLAQTMAAVGSLVAFLPLLNSLAVFEQSAARGVSSLEREIGLSQEQLQAVRDQLAKLLALGAITALGAVAIENLVRVARDPCSACSGTNLLEMEARLESVEFFGET